MRTVALYEMLFGILVIVVGVLVYSHSGLWEHLIAGIAMGTILVGGALRMQKGSRSGLFTNLILTLLTLAYAITRVIADGGFIPGGLLTVVAGVSFLLLLLLLVQPKERKRIF